MLSVQGNIEKKWPEKKNMAFWRGRDASRERLKLIEISREFPNLINASLTNFFFFRDEQEKYGPKVDHISFFKFFDVSLSMLFKKNVFENICLYFYIFSISIS